MSLKDDMLEVASGSFWEIDCYRRVVKRTEDGLHFCNEIMKMIQERAEIEVKYSNKLRLWSKKWSDTIEKSTEYGTNKAVLLNSLSEAESIADAHTVIKNNLLMLQNEVKKWRNDSYKKQMVGICKEARQFEEEFKKAQKPWAKYLGKFLKCKKDYESSYKNLKGLENFLSSSSVSDDQEKKLHDKVDKAKNDVENNFDKMESAFKDLNSYKPIYINDMMDVFEKTQVFEERRLFYVKETLVNLHKCLDISQNDQLPMIFVQWRKIIEMSDPKKDLKWWSENFGAGMDMKWPSLQDCDEADIVQKANQEEDVKSVPEHEIKDTLLLDSQAKRHIYDTKLNPFNSDDEGSLNSSSENPLQDTHNSTRNYPNRDDLMKNVIAIFDYCGQEEDELTFRKGDHFKKLKDKDEQGWCTGMKDGKIGLFPDNYVKVLD